jgi:hypothetical protein
VATLETLTRAMVQAQEALCKIACQCAAATVEADFHSAFVQQRKAAVEYGNAIARLKAKVQAVHDGEETEGGIVIANRIPKEEA